MDDDARQIRQLVDDWVLWRDAGRWDGFATVSHNSAGYLPARVSWASSRGYTRRALPSKTWLFSRSLNLAAST